MQIRQYDVFLVALDPVVGHEIQKTRPCTVISPNEMNDTISTVIIAPMTTRSRSYPSRVNVDFHGKNGWIVLDQIRTVDRTRLVKKLGALSNKEIQAVKTVLQEMLVDW
ncbi:MAG: type II toxin-antitoxin system PemK/MazF family toxin [Spirochaetes bacterium]|jgi:mRNA interferase MazF|nr:type II toxin-antitoxin system PemK/MazF family toxin [Spirochaetota bacterium]